jgi:hypothetical protein
MRRTLGWLAGALGALGAYRALRRRPAAAPALPAGGPDPRAEELKRRLEQSRAADEEREGPAAGEARDPDAKRRGVHARARAAIDEMRRSAPEEGGDAQGEAARDA